MKTVIMLILWNLILSANIELNIKPDLHLIDNQIIDKNIKDSQYGYALKSFLIALDEDQQINVRFSINSKRLIEGVSSSASPLLNGYSKYTSVSDHGEKMNYYVSSPMYMRGVRIVQVAVSPYIYVSDGGGVLLYDDFDLMVSVESLDNYREIINPIPLSHDFSTIISSIVSNYDYRSRNKEHKSCILFVCGGNSLEHPSVQDLIAWREQFGYEVHAAQTAQIGSTTTEIKNYIQDAYQSWQKPPE